MQVTPRSACLAIALCVTPAYAKEVRTSEKRGQCVALAREYVVSIGARSAAPSVEFAHQIYEKWKGHYGRGRVPRIGAIMVLGPTSKNPAGHVTSAVVQAIQHSATNFSVIVSESNAWNDERLSTNVSYEVDTKLMLVKREGWATKVPLKGFLYFAEPWDVASKVMSQERESATGHQADGFFRRDEMLMEDGFFR